MHIFGTAQISSGRHKLPEDRVRPKRFEYGFQEPETIRPGRCSIRQALQFLSEHRTDPDEVGSAESIARRYNLDVKRVDSVLTHFSVFDVEKPKSLTEGAEKLQAQILAKSESHNFGQNIRGDWQHTQNV